MKVETALNILILSIRYFLVGFHILHSKCFHDQTCILEMRARNHCSISSLYYIQFISLLHVDFITVDGRLSLLNINMLFSL